MAKIQWKGSALLAPVPPVLVTTGTLENPNICTVAWCGILSTNPPKTYISLRSSRLSYSMAKKSGEFVINLPTSALVRAIDRCGVKSGREENKFETCKITPVKSSMVAAPTLAESPLSIECRIEQIIPMGSHDMLLASIIAVNAEESLIDAKGKLCLSKAGLACYAHGEYFALGKKIGSFGFSVRKRKKKQNQNNRNNGISNVELNKSKRYSMISKNSSDDGKSYRDENGNSKDNKNGKRNYKTSSNGSGNGNGNSNGKGREKASARSNSHNSENNRSNHNDHNSSNNRNNSNTNKIKAKTKKST